MSRYLDLDTETRVLARVTERYPRRRVGDVALLVLFVAAALSPIIVALAWWLR